MDRSTYRSWITGKDLVSFTVTVKETELFIRARQNLQSKAFRIVLKYREQLEKYIDRHPAFATSLVPLSVTADAPAMVRAMIEATAKAGVGPMASVAGAIAEYAGRELLDYSPEVIIENGGDIFIRSLERRVVGIYTGDSPFTGQLGLQIEPDDTPLGIGTSSGTVGHSLSLGHADAAIVVAPSAALADAAATAVGNAVQHAEDIARALEVGQQIAGVTGVVVVKDDKIGCWGKVTLCRTVTGREAHGQRGQSRGASDRQQRRRGAADRPGASR